MLYQSLILTIPIFLLTLLVVRSVLYSIFDPFILTLFAVSASVGVMFYVSYANHLVDIGTAFLFVLSHIAFIIGLLIGKHTRFWFRFKLRNQIVFLKLSFMDMLLFVVLSIVFLCFILMLRTVGLIIFQSDVQVARTTLLTGGYGILRRILDSGIVFAFALLLVRNHFRHLPTFIFWSCLGFLVMLSASMGTKGFLFAFYTVFVYYLVFLSKDSLFRLPSRVWAIAAVTITLVLAGAVGNLMFTAIRAGNTADGGLLFDSLARLANRVAGFGDIGYLFFENNAYRILQKTLIDYLGYISNDILGFFRLQQYGTAPGAEIYAIVLGSDNPEGFGPNAQVYFVGYIFFQSLGIVYSFLIGWLFAAIRRTTVTNFRTSNLHMLLFIIINYLITPMGMDLQITIVQAFNMVVIIGPLVVLSYVLYAVFNGKVPVVKVQRDSVAIHRPAAPKL